MQLLHSRNSWTFSYGFDMMVDFCVWTLEVDGLHVPPFDGHTNGDGSLRALGLDGENWQRWLTRVVQLQHEQDEMYRKNRSKETVQEKMALFSPEVHNPPLAWQGSEDVRQKLQVLWEQYQKVSNERRAWEKPLTRAWRKDERRGGKRLFDELEPYHKRIEPIAIRLVAYKQPLIYLVPPVSVVMSASQGQPDSNEFRTRVLEAAAGLSNYAPKSWGGAPVFALSSLQGLQPNQQLVVKYKMYAVRPVVSPSPAKQPPLVSDPIKGVVFAYLNDNRHFDEIDWDSVQFKRDKDIPGWHVCWITFKEVDGDEHRRTFILRQETDGSWRIRSSSGGLVGREHWTDFVAPVHDHPQIFISGSKSQGMHKENETTTYEFMAEGEIIDNGFNVARVRLSNEQGQVFEDQVEQGAVFFAALGLEQEVEWPMQAELYDQDGKLVWQQPVFDYKLPPDVRR